MTKNKVILNQKPVEGISNILNEKMSDIDNEEARKNKKAKEVKEMEKVITKKISKSKTLIKRAMEMAKEKTDNPLLLEKLEEYLYAMDESIKNVVPNKIRWKYMLRPLFQPDLTDDERIKMVQQSIEKDWNGFFEVTNKQKNQNKPGLYTEKKELTEDQLEISDLEF